MKSILKPSVFFFFLFITTICSYGQNNSSSMLPHVIYNLEGALENPDNVYHLDLSYQGLTEFPLEILEFKNLQVLDLSGNYISNLPKDITKIQHLEELFLNQNLFPVFPQAILQLQNLRTLELQGNGTPIYDFMEGTNLSQNRFHTKIGK